LSYSTIDDSLERLKNIGSLISSLIIAILTAWLVYYNFYQMPELKFMDFYINPIVGGEDSNKFHDTTLKEDFMEYGSVRTDVYSRKFPFRIRKVKCEKPGILIVGNNITNLGLITANINKIKYNMTYPKQDRSRVINHSKFPLSYQETTFISLRIPWEIEKIWNYALKDGIIMLKFEAMAGTSRCSKYVWIRISDDLKLVEWFETESRFKMLLFEGWLFIEKWT
jgi:hypothetical protein